jgi:hypothetical protein
VIPEVVRQCRQYLLGFGASDIPEQFAFPALPQIQTPSGPEHFPSEMDAFVSWASGYRAPGHGILRLIGDVEDFLTWAMSWCQSWRSIAEEREPPAEDATPPPPPPSVEWCFAPSGDGYFVAGFGESGHLSGYKGLADIARLIEAPGVPIPMLDLEGAGQQLTKDRRSRQPALDATGVQQIVGQLKELRADRERALAENNSVEADAAQAQIEQLEASLATAKGVGGKVRDLNDLYNKLRPKIHGRLRTVYKVMREADPPMKQLADHLELSISCEGASAFIYRPAGDPPPWQFERAEQK